MLNIFDSIILLFAASTTVFATSMIAHVHKCLEWHDKLKIIVFFSTFPLLLFYLGSIVAKEIQSQFSFLGTWILVLILLLLGIRYILKAFRMRLDDRFFDYTQWKVLLGLAIALGMDYFILSIGFEFVGSVLQAILILNFGLLLTAIITGLIFGKKIGKFEWGNRMIFLGGTFFIGITIKIFLQISSVF